MRQASINLSANVLSALLGLLSVFVFTRLFSAHDYGIYLLGVGFASVISVAFIGWFRNLILSEHARNDGNDIRGLGVTGLTIVSENPVYVEGDWNSFNGGVSNFAGASAGTAVIADAVTLLSNNWNDDVSFNNPYTPGARNRINPTWYRLAIIGGKGAAFPQPAGTPTDFGTDGGAHNFLRYLENGDAAVNYLGATATFFYNRQAVGTYKCCTTVYGAPQRNYNFDINFNNPALLPPNTPVFRDMNSVGFSQELRPGR